MTTPHVTIERTALNPQSRRPRILRLKGKEGHLDVHIDREDGGLFFYATGPRLGDRGGCALAIRRAEVVLSSLVEPGEGTLSSGLGAIRLYPDRVLVWKRQNVSSPWRMMLSPEAHEELLTCTREWASGVLRLGAKSA